ncbi:DUF937 domain-containing protein [Kangiella koreensis]|uniref:Uncharacterized protein n=1 Tax=Kangiella koreensis (strain DSM 16069 / JCM 12317 / KCTC 12182 / SW-125) TaxID=523791 RepID=C7R8R0_KANKD|nr:DUF937 domain-containing protein [Kangiella koreensis]ACV25923.1 conserved hypothetical protein [Kangiella koreensis DSM 16069]
MITLMELIFGNDDRPTDQRPLQEIGVKYNLHQEQLHRVMELYLQAMLKGLQDNVSYGGLDALMDALGRNKSEEFLKYPHQIIESKAVDNGNYILGHILKEKDVSRDLATSVSRRTGIDQDTLEIVLPITATFMMGRLGLYLDDIEDSQKRDTLLDILQIEEGTSLREMIVQKQKQLYGE